METLSWTKTRHAYFSLLSKVEPQSLALLAPQIVGLNAGANAALVAEWVIRFRPHMRRSFVHLNDHCDFSRSRVLGTTGLGFSVSSSMRVPKAPQESLAYQAAKLKRVCTYQHAVSYAQGVATLPEMYLLKAQGVRIMVGPIIGEPTELPEGLGCLPFNAVGKTILHDDHVSMGYGSAPQPISTRVH